MLLGKNSQGNIMTHRYSRFDSILRHRQNGVLYVSVRISEDLVQPVTDLLRIERDLLIRDIQIMQIQKILGQPLSVGGVLRILHLALLVGDHTLLIGIDKQDPSRHQT